MRHAVATFVMFACGCRHTAPDAQRESAVAAASLRTTLIQLGVEDQQGRDSAGIAIARHDTLYLQRLAHSDSVRTAWLKTYVTTLGWPHRSIVGDSAAKAAWLILQHSPDFEFQAAMLPELNKLASTNEIAPADVAMLTDRVDVRKGRPQRYGTQFSMQNGTLVPDPIENIGILDSLRADVRLLPMQQYAKMLRELYKQPVQWPPARR